VDWVNTLAEALAAIKSSGAKGRPFDMVVIDLMLNCEMPAELKLHFDALGRKHQKEGQSLGRWLWLDGGRRKDPMSPAHCYFSSVPPHYSEWSNKSETEFLGLQTPDRSASPAFAAAPPLDQLVLSKWSVKPAELSGKIEGIMAMWTSAFPPPIAP
jgi:hypothetical protein